jgi:pimeloyl-ACP methyl ester carboxylesterase
MRVPAADTAAVGTDPSGGEIVERLVSLGPVGLHGILTEPPEPHGPTIVFINEGNTPHIGQSRLWVELARSWAGLGLRCVRFDLSGNGDSPARPGQRSHVARAPEAFDDVVDVTAAVSPDDPTDVVLVGLCAGAYLAMEVALGRMVWEVCLVNPGVAYVPPEVIEGRPAYHRQAVQTTRPWFVAAGGIPLRLLASRIDPKGLDDWQLALKTGTWPVSLAARRPQVPAQVWALVDRVLIRSSPAATFERLVKRGVETHVFCGEPDVPTVTLAAPARTERLKRSSPLFDFHLVNGLDHAALIIEERDALKQALTDHVLIRFPGVAPVS